jgi:putative aldouronate transport system permease protein
MFSANNAASKKLHNISGKKNGNPVAIFLKEITTNISLYTMALPAMICLFLFSYFPMMGLVIAFKEYKFDTGIFGSKWVHPFYYNFNFLFTSDAAIRAIRNTILLNLSFIIIGTVCEVGLALMFSEIGNKYVKKIAQSLTFLPYFVSWIVVGVFAYNFLNFETGSVNAILHSLGLEKVNWYSKTGLWPLLLILFNRWKSTGYGAVVYLAALSSIDETYYEAAEIDGATRLQQIRHISIPLLMPTVIILTLLSVGRIMNADFGMFYSLVGDNAQIYSTTDVIDTFVYRNLRVLGDIGMSSATGLLQSVLSFFLVIGSNKLARTFDKDAAIF